MPASETSRPTLSPPVAQTKPHQFTHHGVTIEDPYAWLRDPAYPTVEDEDILAYLNAENAYFEHYMAPHADLVEEIFSELKARQPEDDASVPYEKNGFSYQWRFAKGAQYRTWHRAPVASPEDWQVLLDENALASGHDYFKLGAISVSPDARKLAYAIDTDGSERFELHIIDLATRQALTPSIPNTLGSPVWNAASSQLLYVIVSEEWRPYRVLKRALSGSPTSSAADPVVYEETDTGFFVGLDESQSEQFVFIASGSHTSNEIRYLPKNDFDAQLHLMAGRQAHTEYDADHRGDQFVIRSNHRHENFDLFSAPVTATDRDQWSLLIAGDARNYITAHLALKDYLIVCAREDGLDQIRIYRDDQPAPQQIGFPETAYSVGLGTISQYATSTLRLNYSSMVTPQTVYDYAIADDALAALKVQEIPSGYDASQYVTSRLMAPVRDGVHVPISLVHRQDTPLDGSAPLYLYGYGAYGICIPPSFSASRISLLDRGFIYAIAHIRGGDDLGYSWYTQGKLMQRENTFNDFVDCAHHLIGQNFTRAGQIAIAGGSAGGELMGAVVNQAPDLWGAAAAHVPFVDVLNTMLDASLPLTPIEWPEWGNPIEDSEVFTYIRSYSPYDQLKPGHYPPMLVTAGINDPRVTYWEPAKYVARLRALKQDSNVLILKTNMEAGHGGRSGRYDSLKETAEEFVFFLAELGAGAA
jgi:oligopeptidase B